MMKTILVIEDEVESREMVLECLEAEGFHTIAAANGRLGVQLAQEHLPDLVICDIVMPELNGYEVLTTLRQNLLTHTIPFIFMTAMTLEAERCYGMKLAADSYLTKPCTVDDLLKAIAKTQS
jgi:CheY-like chemotaxis protein